MIKNGTKQKEPYQKRPNLVMVSIKKPTPLSAYFAVCLAGSYSSGLYRLLIKYDNNGRRN